MMYIDIHTYIVGQHSVLTPTLEQSVALDYTGIIQGIIQGRIQILNYIHTNVT